MPEINQSVTKFAEACMENSVKTVSAGLVMTIILSAVPTISNWIVFGATIFSNILILAPYQAKSRVVSRMSKRGANRNYASYELSNKGFSYNDHEPEYRWKAIRELLCLATESDRTSIAFSIKIIIITTATNM